MLVIASPLAAITTLLVVETSSAGSSALALPRIRSFGRLLGSSRMWSSGAISSLLGVAGGEFSIPFLSVRPRHKDGWDGQRPPQHSHCYRRRCTARAYRHFRLRSMRCHIEDERGGRETESRTILFSPHGFQAARHRVVDRAGGAKADLVFMR
jgi:hypothetical protein